MHDTSLAPPRRPRMSAAEATVFEGGRRLSGYVQVGRLLAERKLDQPERFAGCTCEPYADVFTFARWRALGFGVAKGEKSMRHSCFVRTDGTTTETEDGEEVKPGHLRPWVTHLFCRCQVAPTPARGN